MKKIILATVLILGFIALQERHSISRSFNPTPFDPNQTTVSLYSTSWCGYCAKVRVLLRRHEIPYTEYDIEESAAAKAKYKALGGGGVPITVINEHTVRGYDPKKILHFLGR